MHSTKGNVHLMSSSLSSFQFLVRPYLNVGCTIYRYDFHYQLYRIQTLHYSILHLTINSFHLLLTCSRSHSGWDANKGTRLIMYCSLIWSKFGYGYTVYGSACHTKLKKVDPAIDKHSVSVLKHFNIPQDMASVWRQMSLTFHRLGWNSCFSTL